MDREDKATVATVVETTRATAGYGENKRTIGVKVTTEYYPSGIEVDPVSNVMTVGTEVAHHFYIGAQVELSVKVDGVAIPLSSVSLETE